MLWGSFRFRGYLGFGGPFGLLLFVVVVEGSLLGSFLLLSLFSSLGIVSLLVGFLGISLGLCSSLQSRNLLFVDGLLLQGSFLGLLFFHRRFFARVLLGAETISGGHTWGNLAQRVWHAEFSGQDPLLGVAVVIPRPVEKVVMPLTTRRPINQSLAWIERFALPGLGLAGPDLMIPCPVEAENTASGLLDNCGPLIN